MLYDAFGKTVGPNTLITPEWVMSLFSGGLRDARDEARVRELRESILGWAEASGLGKTVTIKKPARYQR